MFAGTFDYSVKVGCYKLAVWESVKVCLQGAGGIGISGESKKAGGDSFLGDGCAGRVFGSAD